MSIDHIDRGLHITSIRSAQSHSTATFDMVVSVCQDACEQNISDETPYEHYRLADGPTSEGEWGGSCAYGLFEEAAESVVAALEDDSIENVLVHCHVGKNRSAAICAAALGAYDDLTFEVAYECVRSSRPMVNPNATMRSHARRFIEARSSSYQS